MYLRGVVIIKQLKQTQILKTMNTAWASAGNSSLYFLCGRDPATAATIPLATRATTPAAKPTPIIPSETANPTIKSFYSIIQINHLQVDLCHAAIKKTFIVTKCKTRWEILKKAVLIFSCLSSVFWPCSIAIFDMKKQQRLWEDQSANAWFYLLQFYLQSFAWEQRLAESLGKSAATKTRKCSKDTQLLANLINP